MKRMTLFLVVLSLMVPVVAETYPHTVIATIPVGNGPLHIAVLPSGDYVYVANWSSDTVSVIRVSSISAAGIRLLRSGGGGRVDSPVAEPVAVFPSGSEEEHGVSEFSERQVDKEQARVEQQHNLALGVHRME